MRTSHATRGLLLTALALALVALAAAPGSGARPGSVERYSFGAPRGQYVPGEVIVGFRAHASRADLARMHGRVPARVTHRFAGLRMEVVKVARGLSVTQAIRRYELDPAVAFAEPNYIRHVNATFTDLWGLNNTSQSHPAFDWDQDGTESTVVGTAGADINAPEAWATTRGDANTVVAVIDTGVDITHPDLATQLWTNPADPPGNGDDDGNGLLDDVNGWDFAENDNTLLDTGPGPHFGGYEHGTHVAGTIAGDDDGNDIVGVCPGCKIMVLKIADTDGNLVESAEIAALEYAHSKGIKIANMSFGGPLWSNAEREAIRILGLLAVVSAGNDALDNDMALGADIGVGNSDPDVFSPSFPASFTLNNIIAVGASNDRDRNAYSTECVPLLGSRAECAFSNWGHDSVDLVAPGVDVESSIPGPSWETWDGTSMAAPHVAGTAGLVLSQHPSYTVAQLKNALMRGVNRPDTLKTMYIPARVAGNSRSPRGTFSRTAGRMNASRALGAGTRNATPLTDGNVNGAKGMSTPSVSGSVSWPADVNDVWKRKLYAGHFYRFTLVVPAGEDYDLFVWKPRTKEIWQFDNPSGPPTKLQKDSITPANGADEVVQFTAGSTGVYYIHVSAWLFKSGSYRLTLKRIS